MWILTVCLFTIRFFDRTNASSEVSLEDLLERLESLEEWKRETESEVSALRDLVTKQGIIIRNLERELAVQTHNAVTLKHGSQQRNQVAHEHQTDRDEINISEEQEPKNTIRASQLKNQRTSQFVGHRAISGEVAFTAYLDHPLNPGGKQTIKFNKVITNDGNAYSVQTGVFTCPVSGVYMFTFVIGQRGIGGQSEMWAELVVNSHLLVGASVDAYHDRQDLQGVNTVVVRLNYGDAVWVDAMYPDDHVEGNPSRRFTSFTGIFLYG